MSSQTGTYIAISVGEIKFSYWLRQLNQHTA